MIVVGLVFAGLAALVHVYIFVLEAVLWQGPRARRIFGMSPEQASATAFLALNQAFYNLFLAIDVLVGMVLIAAGQFGPGLVAVVIGAGSMVLAGIVLMASDRTKARAAAIQAVPPVLAVLALLIAVGTGSGR